MLDFHGSVTPSAKTTALALYSPSEVWRVKRSSSWVVDSHAQPYRTETPACSQKEARPRSISAREGTMKVRSISGTISAWQCASSATRLLWSYHSYSRVQSSAGASGFVQESRRWQIGHLRNIPPGESSWEMTACSTPSLERQ